MAFFNFDIDHEETIQASLCEAETQTEITVEILDQTKANRKEIREEGKCRKEERRVIKREKSEI